jgi:hypothetical protein
VVGSDARSCRKENVPFRAIRAAARQLASKLPSEPHLPHRNHRYVHDPGAHSGCQCDDPDAAVERGMRFQATAAWRPAHGSLHGGPGRDTRRDGQLDTREWGGIVSVGAGGARGDAFPAATSASVSLRTQPLPFAQTTGGSQVLSTTREIGGGQGEGLSGGRGGGDLRGQTEGGYQEGMRGPQRAVPCVQSLGRALHDPRLHGWHRTLAHFGTIEEASSD